MKGQFNDLVDVSVICVLAVVPLALMAIFFYGLFSFFSPRACGMERPTISFLMKGEL
jgi:hypothetical protein